MVKAGYMTGDESGEKLDWLKRVVATAQTQVDYGAQVPEKVAFTSRMISTSKMKKPFRPQKKKQCPLSEALIEGFHSTDELNHDSVKGLQSSPERQQTERPAGLHAVPRSPHGKSAWTGTC